MKNKIILVFFLSLFIIPLGVNAEDYYDNVEIVTTFDSAVDVTDITSIVVLFDDCYDNTFDVLVNSDQDFKKDVSGVGLGSIDFSLAMVSRDYNYDYTIEHTITRTSDRELVINLTVRNRGRDQSASVAVSDDILNRIYNDDSTSSGDDTIIIETPESTTTTSTTSINDVIDEEQERAITDLSIKTRNNIYVIVFLTIGAIILVLIALAAIKISKANK